jgi:hypothetical protein
MNRSVFLGVLGVTVGVVACGGDTTDIAANDAGPDTAVVDTGLQVDTGTPPPNDSGVTPDTGIPIDDSGTDAIVPVNDAGSFNVGKVTGLALWLDAAKGVTQAAGKVSSWADQSGNNNNAAQSNGNNRPGFTASAINSLPGVHFDMAAQAGTFMTIVDSPTLSWTTGDYYLVAVARYNNDPQQQGNFTNRFGTLYFKEGQNPSAGPALFANTPGNTVTSGFATQMSNAAADRLLSTGTGYNDNKGHSFSVHRGGTTLELRHNGNLDGTKTVTAVDVSAPTIDVTIGASGGGGFAQARLNGDIAEVIAVKGAISSGDLSGIEGYLKAKYALP